MEITTIYLVGLTGCSVAFLYVVFNRFDFFRRNPVGRTIPFIAALGGLALVVYAHVALTRNLGMSATPLLRAIGLFWFAAAAIVYGLCWELAFFARPQGAYSRVLYTGGMYALCRNPQALALGLAVVGQMFYVARAPMWGFCLINLLFLYLYAVAEEKLEMKPRFGEQYRKYLSGTPRLLPTGKSLRKCVRTFGGRNREDD